MANATCERHVDFADHSTPVDGRFQEGFDNGRSRLLLMRSFIVFAVWLISSAWSSQAQASGRSTEAQVRAAQKACLTGAPAKGVEILTDLYLDTRDPTHIFNQGRCFEMNRRYEDAIARFREYMVKAKNLMSTEEKADAEKHIAACQSYLATPKPEYPQTGGQRASPSGPIVPSPAQQTPGPQAAGFAHTTILPPMLAPYTTTQQAAPVHAGRKGSGLRTAGLVTGAVGGAALVAGVILNLKVNSMSSDLEKQYNYDPGTDSTRNGYKTAGWVGYGIGATCLVGGAVLYYLGWRQGSTFSVEPAIAPSMAGAMLTGTF
jgi:hypothetical protein